MEEIEERVNKTVTCIKEATVPVNKGCTEEK